MLVVLVAVAMAAPVPQIAVYSDCTLKSFSNAYCPLLIGTAVGYTYCCQDRAVTDLVRSTPLGAFCVGLAEGLSVCPQVVTAASGAWCCAEPDAFDDEQAVDSPLFWDGDDYG